MSTSEAPVNGARGGVAWSSDYNVPSLPKKPRAKPGPSDRVMARRPGTTQKAIVNVSEWPSDSTTLMLRNIPSRYTQEEILEELINKGFSASFDYFHLMMDISTKRNRGFAFLNMRSPALALQIHAEFHGLQLPRYKTEKVLEVSLAEVQGLHANAISYLNAHRNRVQNVWFKPIIFVHAPGEKPDWKAIPLNEANLPEEIAHVYGSHPTRSEQRQRVLTASHASKLVTESASQHLGEDGMEADELLIDGEYDEISAQVSSFLASQCSGANQSSDALLAALDKPRRRKGGKRAKKRGDRIHEDSQAAPSGVTSDVWTIDLASCLPGFEPVPSTCTGTTHFFDEGSQEARRYVETSWEPKLGPPTWTPSLPVEPYSFSKEPAWPVPAFPPSLGPNGSGTANDQMLDRLHLLLRNP